MYQSKFIFANSSHIEIDWIFDKKKIHVFLNVKVNAITKKVDFIMIYKSSSLNQTIDTNFRPLILNYWELTLLLNSFFIIKMKKVLII